MIPQQAPTTAALLGTGQDPNSGDCIPMHKSPPNPADNCRDPIFANPTPDKCAEPGTLVAQDIEHNIGSRSSGGGEHKGGKISTTPPQVTEAIPSGLAEMIPTFWSILRFKPLAVGISTDKNGDAQSYFYLT